jgi:hypothetical protein
MYAAYELLRYDVMLYLFNNKHHHLNYWLLI